MDIKSPETPGRFSLRLDVYSPSQVLQTNGRFYHAVLAFRVVEETTYSRVPLLRESYLASPLIRTHPSPSRLRLISLCEVIQPTFFPSISRWDEEGFASCLACPCHRAVAATPPEESAASTSMRQILLSSTLTNRLDLRGLLVSRLHLRSHMLQPGDSLTIHYDGFVDGLQVIRFHSFLPS